jgi:hypothetical protein
MIKKKDAELKRLIYKIKRMESDYCELKDSLADNFYDWISSERGEDTAIKLAMLGDILAILRGNLHTFKSDSHDKEE